jgi:hypothetical protein
MRHRTRPARGVTGGTRRALRFGVQNESTPALLAFLLSERESNSSLAREQRRIGLRVDTQFPVVVHDGETAAHCRAVELSATGVVIERARGERAEDRDAIVQLELLLPDRDRPVSAFARLVRVIGTRHALAFVTISDADRLTLMEHLDKNRANSSDANSRS